MYDFSHCTLCPRRCGANRYEGKGFCGAPAVPKAARAALHFGEEPCISGSRGSGTVFFSGCNLRCVFCQNFEVSFRCFGSEFSVAHLAEIFLQLQEQGAHNINLVSAAPYVPLIVEALHAIEGRLHIPVVYNCGGYEAADTLAMLDGLVDIYLPDFKYVSPELARRYSSSADYAQVALAALRAMIRQTGKPRFDGEGMLQKGVIVRHLVLPGAYKDSLEVLRLLASEFPHDAFLLSLMSQYTPDFLRGDFPELKRRLTGFEYAKVTDMALELGLDNGYMQERSSAQKSYTPQFDLEGI